MAPDPFRYAGRGCLVLRPFQQPSSEFRILAVVATGAAPQLHQYAYGKTRMVRMDSES